MYICFCWQLQRYLSVAVFFSLLDFVSFIANVLITFVMVSLLCLVPSLFLCVVPEHRV